MDSEEEAKPHGWQLLFSIGSTYLSFANQEAYSFEVEKVLDHHNGGHIQYQLRWKCDMQLTWQMTRAVLWYLLDDVESS